MTPWSPWNDRPLGSLVFTIHGDAGRARLSPAEETQSPRLRSLLPGAAGRAEEEAEPHAHASGLCGVEARPPVALASCLGFPPAVEERLRAPCVRFTRRARRMRTSLAATQYPSHLRGRMGLDAAARCARCSGSPWLWPRTPRTSVSDVSWGLAGALLGDRLLGFSLSWLHSCLCHPEPQADDWRFRAKAAAGVLCP